MSFRFERSDGKTAASVMGNYANDMYDVTIQPGEDALMILLAVSITTVQRHFLDNIILCGVHVCTCMGMYVSLSTICACARARRDTYISMCMCACAHVNRHICSSKYVHTCAR